MSYFFKPEQVRFGPSCLDEDFNLHLHRPVGSECVNPYNPVIVSTLKCNYDVKLVLGCESKHIAAYVCKYCKKPQNSVENQLALSLAAFNKASVSADRLPSDAPAETRGYRIIASMLYSLTNGQEVAAPMAALYILRDSPFWFSHDVLYVNFRQLLEPNLQIQEVSIPIETDEDHTKTIVSKPNLLQQYWRREERLEHVSLVSICEQYHQASHPKNMTQNITHERLLCYFEKSASRKCLVLSGSQIPDINSELDEEDTIFFYQSLLLLFKPHRQATFLDGNRSPAAEYQQFLRSTDYINIADLEAFQAKLLDFYHSETRESQPQETPEAELLYEQKEL